MYCLRRVILALALAILVAGTVPAVKAAESGEANWPRYITLSEPFQIGDLTFSPGTYFFQLTKNTVSRNVMMVYNCDRNRWEGMIMGINAQRENEWDKPTGFTFIKQGNGKPMALEYWFYPNWNRGIKFTRHELGSTLSIANSGAKEPLVFVYSAK